MKKVLISLLISAFLASSAFAAADVYKFNPHTGRLDNVGGGGTSGSGGTIGSATGGTSGSVLFVGPTGLMAQDNPAFSYFSGTYFSTYGVQNDMANYNFGDFAGRINGNYLNIDDASDQFIFSNSNNNGRIDMQAATPGAGPAYFNFLAPVVFNDFTTGQKTAYVGPSGSDSNTGLTSASPFATLTKAAAMLGGVGEIVMLAGDYTNIKLDIGGMQNIKIRGVTIGRVRVFLGEYKANGGSVFTSVGSGVYSVPITTVIPVAVYPNNGINQFVFEQNTPEGAISTASEHPSQKSRSYRLDHYRLKQVVNLAAVVAGTYFYNSGTGLLYFKRTDSANPNSTGSGIWIPSQTLLQSFVYGAVGGEQIEIDNIEVYYGYENFRFDSSKRAVTRNILSYGAGQSGISSHQNEWTENWYPEYCASSTDGHAITGTSGPPTTYGQTKTFDYFPWGHDNGDQAITAHSLSISKVVGGLVEYNNNGGIFGGGQTEVQGTYSQYNKTCGFGITITPGTGEAGVTMDCNGCTSNNDQIGFYSTGTPGHLIARNGAVYNATQYAFAANAPSVIEYSNIDVFNNAALTGGGGTFSPIEQGTATNFSIRQNHAVRGTNAVFQLDPEFHPSMTLGVPLGLIGGESTAYTYSTLGYGFTNATYSIPAVESGFKLTDATNGMKGSWIVALRDVTTNTAPTIRYEIDAWGRGSMNTSLASSLGTLQVLGTGTGGVTLGQLPSASGYGVISLVGNASAYTLAGSASDANLYVSRASGGDINFQENYGGLQMVLKSGGNLELNSGKLSKYNALTTIGNGVPSELAEINSTGLTANVAASTLYAVPSTGEGLYRVSAYLVTTTAASVSSTMPNAQVVFTDKDSNTSVTMNVSPILGAAGLGQSGLLTANTVGAVYSGVTVIYVKASTTIQYQTVNYASTAAGMAYALRIKLETL